MGATKRSKHTPHVLGDTQKTLSEVDALDNSREAGRQPHGRGGGERSYPTPAPPPPLPFAAAPPTHRRGSRDMSLGSEFRDANEVPVPRLWTACAGFPAACCSSSLPAPRDSLSPSRCATLRRPAPAGPGLARVLLGNGPSPGSSSAPPAWACHSFQNLRGSRERAGPRQSWRSRVKRNGNPSAVYPERLPSLGKRRCLRGNRKPVVTPDDPVCFRSVSKHWEIETRRPYVACLRAIMDTLVEDDICILNHEKAHRRDTVTPVSIYSGDESVASHFALVTAYEDIKKRLKDSEKENSFLKKRIRFLEEKLLGARLDEETSSVGREQVNKAYHAYREVCIDRDNLKNKLDKMNKDNSESLKVLNEQLQSKEVELLQLRTEVETQQVIRNLNPPSSNWEVEKLSCDLKIHGLEQELELMRKECNDLKVELQKAKQTDLSQEDSLQSRDFQRLSISSDNMQNAYWELKREMSNLHLVTQVQAELLRKLKTPTAIKKACTPVGCMEDLGKDSTKLHLTNFTASYKRHPPLSPDGKTLCHSTSSPLPGDIKALSEKAILQSWTDNKQPIPHDGTNFQEHNSFGRNSLEDNSWVFPSPPKSSDTAFGETKNKTLLLPNLPPLHYLDQHNQNCLYKN